MVVCFMLRKDSICLNFAIPCWKEHTHSHSFTVWITLCFTLWITVCSTMLNWGVFTLWSIRFTLWFTVWITGKRKEHTHSHSFTVWITLCFTLCSQCELWFHTVIHNVNECEWVCSFQQGYKRWVIDVDKCSCTLYSSFYVCYYQRRKKASHSLNSVWQWSLASKRVYLHNLNIRTLLTLKFHI